MTQAQKKTSTRRFIVWSIAAVILVLIAWSLVPDPLPADFATVDRGLLRVTIDEEGETRVRDRFVVSAPLAGRVLRIELEPGDPVIAGDTVLATFQPTDPVLLDARSRAEAEARVKAAESAIGRARADRDRTQAELKKAEADLERARRLAGEEIVSAEQLEAAELNHDTRLKAVRAADFAVRTTTYDLEIAQASLVEPGEGQSREPILLRSPVDGTVLKRLRESESVVPAGEPLLEVADPADLEIVSDLLSTDAVKVRRGQKVLIEQWGGEHPLHGVVRRVEPSGFMKISALGVEEQRVNVIVDFEDAREAWQALGDGFRVEVRIVTWQQDDVLTVPSSSLFRHGVASGETQEAGWAVFAVEGGIATLRNVDIGMRNSLSAQILGGLEEGQRIIVHPSDSIEDGVKVEERDV